MPRISWAGVGFYALVELDEDEVVRREAVGLGSMTQFSTLRALSSLPLGFEVSWHSLDPVLAGYLGGLDEGLVSLSPTGVTRLIRPPLTILALHTMASNWRVLGRIGILASDAPVNVILKHRPRNESLARACAERHGIGLSYLSGTSVRELQPTAPKVVPSLRRTRLMEVVFGQWRRVSDCGNPREPEPCLQLL